MIESSSKYTNPSNQLCVSPLSSIEVLMAYQENITCFVLRKFVIAPGSNLWGAGQLFYSNTPQVSNLNDKTKPEVELEMQNDFKRYKFVKNTNKQNIVGFFLFTFLTVCSATLEILVKVCLFSSCPPQNIH